jgi:hypothetical protein
MLASQESLVNHGLSATASEIDVSANTQMCVSIVLAIVTCHIRQPETIQYAYEYFLLIITTMTINNHNDDNF